MEIKKLFFIPLFRRELMVTKESLLSFTTKKPNNVLEVRSMIITPSLIIALYYMNLYDYHITTDFLINIFIYCSPG